MATKRRFIPDPEGSVRFEAPDGVVTTMGNDPSESNLDSWAGPWSPGVFAEQYGEGREGCVMTVPDQPRRKLTGTMKNGR